MEIVIKNDNVFILNDKSILFYGKFKNLVNGKYYLPTKFKKIDRIKVIDNNLFYNNKIIEYKTSNINIIDFKALKSIKQYNLDKNTFYDNFKKSIDFVSSNVCKINIKCIHIEILENMNVRMVAKVLVVNNAIDNSNIIYSFDIPYESISMLEYYLKSNSNQYVNIGTNNEYISIDNNNIIIKLASNNYPNYDKIIPLKPFIKLFTINDIDLKKINTDEIVIDLKKEIITNEEGNIPLIINNTKSNVLDSNYNQLEKYKNNLQNENAMLLQDIINIENDLNDLKDLKNKDNEYLKEKYGNHFDYQEHLEYKIKNKKEKIEYNNKIIETNENLLDISIVFDKKYLLDIIKNYGNNFLMIYENSNESVIFTFEKDIVILMPVRK